MMRFRETTFEGLTRYLLGSHQSHKEDRLVEWGGRGLLVVLSSQHHHRLNAQTFSLWLVGIELKFASKRSHFLIVELLSFRAACLAAAN